MYHVAGVASCAICSRSPRKQRKKAKAKKNGCVTLHYIKMPSILVIHRRLISFSIRSEREWGRKASSGGAWAALTEMLMPSNRWGVQWNFQSMLEHLIVLKWWRALVCITLCRRSVLSRTERNYFVNKRMRMCGEQQCCDCVRAPTTKILLSAKILSEWKFHFELFLIWDKTWKFVVIKIALDFCS